MASNSVVTTPSAALLASDIEQVVIDGDLSRLSPEQRLSYYRATCASLGLNPLTKPFDYLRLNGKVVLYSTKSCTDQLRMIHKISVDIVSEKRDGDIYIVKSRATAADGRHDEGTGAVSLGALKGEALANAYMKAETKSKRRVTLSICGLSVVDDSEIDSIPGAKRVSEAELTKLNTIETKLSPTVEKASETKEKAGVPGGEYRIPFGKFVGKRLEEVSPAELLAYANALIEDFAKNKKPIAGRVAEFLGLVEKMGAQQ